jgi:hypothetical protein
MRDKNPQQIFHQTTTKTLVFTRGFRKIHEVNSAKIYANIVKCTPVKFNYKAYSLYSPLHIQAILRWHVAPGLLKSQAAQAVSSTIADGCKRFVRIMLGYIAPEIIILMVLSALYTPLSID